MSYYHLAYNIPVQVLSKHFCALKLIYRVSQTKCNKFFLFIIFNFFKTYTVILRYTYYVSKYCLVFGTLSFKFKILLYCIVNKKIKVAIL